MREEVIVSIQPDREAFFELPQKKHKKNASPGMPPEECFQHGIMCFPEI
jgi:hypothetical protein